jgi:hypothetical protein
MRERKKIPRERSKQTLIERLAIGGFYITWDEAAKHENVNMGSSKARRGMYQIIPCLDDSEIYPYSSTKLAFLCRRNMRITHFKKKAPEWMELFLDCDGEAIFLFPVSRWEEAIPLIKPRKMAQRSKQQRKLLAVQLKKAREAKATKSKKNTPAQT